ncbi:MAG: hypothetical protein WCD02_03385 [Terriglobales bacterium]
MPRSIGRERTNPPSETKARLVRGFMPIQSVVYKAVELFAEKSIEIPRVFLARNAQVANYDDFELDLKGLHFKPQPVSNRVPCPPEARLEEYLVRRLVDFEYVCYEHHRQLLHKLAGAVVQHLQSYLSNLSDHLKSGHT